MNAFANAWHTGVRDREQDPGTYGQYALQERAASIDKGIAVTVQLPVAREEPQDLVVNLNTSYGEAK